MTNPPEQRTRRVTRKPTQFHGSPVKKAKKTKTRSTKNRNDPIEYDIKVLSVCRCVSPNWALCHFVDYDKSHDRWKPLQELSVEAMVVATTCTTTSCSPKCCKRLQNQGQFTGVSDPFGSTTVPLPASPVVPPSTRAVAAASLCTIVIPPFSPHKRVVPPVPVFSPLPSVSPPLAPPQHQPPVSRPVLFANPAISIPNLDLGPPPPSEQFQTVPNLVEYLPVLIDNLYSSMSHSFGPNFWKSTNASIWRSFRADTVSSLKATMEDPTPLSIFQACNDLLMAPSRFLRHIGFVRAVPASKNDQNPHDATVKAAAEAIKKGQASKALRILTGTGAAPHTQEQLERTSEMFPGPKKRVLFNPSLNDLTINRVTIDKEFNRLVSSTEPESSDLYGWDPVLFRDPEAPKDFIKTVSEFLFAFINWNHAPVICSQLFNAGTVISIFKLTESERKRLSAETKHGIRPIGSQCLFGKIIDREVLQSKEARNIKTCVRPVQKVFNSRGIVSIPAIALGALKQGYAVLKGDFKNAFGEICRLAILENLDAKEPSLASYYSRSLLHMVPLFTRDDKGSIEVLWVSTGVVQGAVPSTLLFAAGVMKLYSKLSEEFSDFVLAAATDDLNSLLKPAQDDYDGWQVLFRRLADFLQRYESLAEEFCSLHQNIAKGAIVLPANAPMPTEEILHLFPETFKFHHVTNVMSPGVPFKDRTDGFVICGAPVGSDFYLDAFARWKTDAAITKIVAIRRLSENDAIPTPKHVAFKLLASCGPKLLSFFATTVPPQFTVRYLKKYDKHLKNAFLHLLGDWKCSDLRNSRAFLRVTLPISQGGLGLLKTSVSAAALWWTNYRCLQADPANQPFLQGLQSFAPEAITLISAEVGGNESKSWLDLAPLFITPEVYDEAPDSPPKNLLKTILIAIGKAQASELKALFDPSTVDPERGSLTKSDVISFHARSNLNIVFNSKRLKNMSNEHFVKLTCTFLGLPQPHERGNATHPEGFDHSVEMCMTQHNKNTSAHLDVNGDHHSGSCPSANLAVSQRHTNLISVLSKFANEAGALTSREPNSHKLLQGCLTEIQCSRLFPKLVPVAYKKVANEILDALAQLPPDKPKIDALYKSLPVLDPLKCGALRVDVAIKNPSNNKVYLVDGSYLHTSCANYRNPEFTSLVKRIQSAEAAEDQKASNPLLWEPSKSIEAKVKSKIDKHAPLMQIISKFQRDSMLDGQHSFVPFVVSSLGELSREAYCFKEELVSMFKFKIKNTLASTFPFTPAQAVADFRSRLTAELMYVTALGLARIVSTGGKPFGNRSIFAVL